MSTLTPTHEATQDRVLAFVKAYHIEHGCAPSTSDIMGACAIKSTSTVHYHVERLRKRGLLVRGNGRRTIRAVTPAGCCPTCGQRTQPD